MTPATETAWSCMLDDTPQIWSSFVPWLATITELAGVPTSALHVHHVCEIPRNLRRVLDRMQITTHACPRFDGRFPHTNKIQQCHTDFGAAKKVILTDVDLAFMASLPVDKIKSPVAGKLVDLPNPPMDVLHEIFAAADLSVPETISGKGWPQGKSAGGFETFATNVNGGLYLVDRTILAEIGESWAHWANWLIGRSDMLGRWAMHVDQVAFCLVASDLSLEVQLLPSAWNHPLHLSTLCPDDEPFVLHHHGMLQENLHIKHGNGNEISGAITRVNIAIDQFREKHCI